MNKTKEFIKTITKNNKERIDKRLNEFKKNNKKSYKKWFVELCYCILTANSKAKTAIQIEKELNYKLLNIDLEELKETIKKHKHRFYNLKSKYIIEAQEHKTIKQDIKKIIKNETYKEISKARDYLVKNIKGIGLKEASHFLRNIGYFELAILDRHILKTLKELDIIKEIPKPLTRKKYLEIEQKFIKLAKDNNLKPAELDFYIWCYRSNEIIK